MKIEKYTKYKAKPEGSHLVRYKNEIDYEYYICSYCHKEIKIEKDWEKISGGIVLLPASLICRSKPMKIAIHNRCLKKLIAEIENKNFEHIEILK